MTAADAVYPPVVAAVPKPRFRYRPPRSRRAVGVQNDGWAFLKTGWSMRYTCRGPHGIQNRAAATYRQFKAGGWWLTLSGRQKNRGGVLENGMVDAVCPPPRFLYRPPHPRRAVDGLLLVGGQNGGGRFLKTGWSMRYTCRGSIGCRKPRFRYRPPRSRRVVDGLFLVGD